MSLFVLRLPDFINRSSKPPQSVPAPRSPKLFHRLLHTFLMTTVCSQLLRKVPPLAGAGGGGTQSPTRPSGVCSVAFLLSSAYSVCEDIASWSRGVGWGAVFSQDRQRVFGELESEATICSSIVCKTPK